MRHRPISAGELCGSSLLCSGKQLPFNVNARAVDKHAFGSAGTSRNETTDVESVSRVREASGTVQLVSYKMRQLSAIAN